MIWVWGEVYGGGGGVKEIVRFRSCICLGFKMSEKSRFSCCGWDTGFFVFFDLFIIGAVLGFCFYLLTCLLLMEIVSSILEFFLRVYVMTVRAVYFGGYCFLDWNRLEDYYLGVDIWFEERGGGNGNWIFSFLFFRRIFDYI